MSGEKEERATISKMGWRRGRKKLTQKLIDIDVRKRELQRNSITKSGNNNMACNIANNEYIP